MGSTPAALLPAWSSKDNPLIRARSCHVLACFRVLRPGVRSANDTIVGTPAPVSFFFPFPFPLPVPTAVGSLPSEQLPSRSSAV